MYAINRDWRAPVRPGWTEQRTTIYCDRVPNFIRVVSLVRDELIRGRKRISAHLIKAPIVGGLAAADLGFHRKAMGGGYQIDFRRSATRYSTGDFCIDERGLSGQNLVTESPANRHVIASNHREGFYARCFPLGPFRRNVLPGNGW